MADANKFGRYAPGGGIEAYPDVSISGRPYDFPPTQIAHVDRQRFVVLDVYPVAGYDVSAELAKLRRPEKKKPTAEAEG